MSQTIPSESEPESGTVQFEAGDSGTAKDLIAIRDEETFRINDYILSYGANGTTPADVEFYDEPAGTAEADVSELIEIVRVSPDDNTPVVDIARNDVEDDVVVVVRNNDGVVSITMGGHSITG
jgi:hypothetical protein